MYSHKLSHTARALAVVLALLPATALFAQEAGTGRILGVVRDDFNAMTLPTASVRVLGLDVSTLADLDGRYSLELPAGTYQLEVGMPGYDTVTVTDVVVTAGATTELDVALRLPSVREDVIVTAEIEPELATAAAQLLERKRAGVITDNLAREEMRANADSDAAAAMKRVTGLSVVDNQYVYVRGLGERYSNTMLNGGVLPTTEPDKRVVPLDLIPTGLIESVQVVKSYLPDRPAEFSGGLIQIESIKAPRDTAMTVSTKQGFNTRTAWEDGLVYTGGGTDWLGFDDGIRALPGNIPDDKVTRASPFVPGRGYSPEQLAEFGRSFSNIWSPRYESQSHDPDFSTAYGTRMGRVGLALSIGYRGKTRTRTEEQTYYSVGEDLSGNPTLEAQNDYDFELTDTRTRLGGIGNLSYELGANHRFSWANFWTHNSKNEARTFEGFNADIATDIRNSRLYWIEEDILSSTLRGEHLVPSLLNSRIDWRLNYSRAQRDEPDLREVLYEYNPAIDKFVLADESQSGFRMFNDLQDEVYDGGVDWSLFFSQWDGLPAQLKIGVGYSQRERDFQSRRFRFAPRNTRSIDTSLPPEELFTPENIGPIFELREETRNTDAYQAEHTIASGYAMVDLPLGRKFRLVGGARVEDSDQVVETFDLFAVEPTPTTATLENTDVLPGVNLIYALSNRVNLRGSYSRTVNRPEFRELSEFEFTDVVGGRAVIGNPDLRRATIDNFDIRWEWFPTADEVLAVSVFYKDFTDPIERVVEPTAQLRTSYTNALAATNKGIEVEARKRLDRNFAVNLNYTYVDSRTEFAEQELQIQTSLERSLVGQSPHVVNAMLIFEAPEQELSLRGLFNYFGERITDVGAGGLPDIYEDGREQVDLVLEKRFGLFGLQIQANNLTDSDYRFSQGGEPQRLYRIGREFAFKLSYTVF